MSRDALYTEYAEKILKFFPPKDQEDMEKFLQMVVICTEKCIKSKRSQEAAASNKVWLAYSKAYKERWGVAPPASPKNYALCKQLMQSVGAEVFELIDFYLKQTDSWYVKSYHSLSALLANQNYQGLLTRLKAGKQKRLEATNAGK